MCGIMGICLDGRERDWDQIRTQMASLITESQVRGIDAAGIYIINKKHETLYLSFPGIPEEMLTKREYLEIMDTISTDTVAIIGHTRAATLGSPQNNDNNHPIYDHPIIGVHNGVIRNHAILDKKYGKIAEVDSAAIMAMLRYKVGDKPLTVKTLATSLDELSGPFAIAVADVRHSDRLYLARNSNPVSLGIRRKGGIYFASTKQILEDALGRDCPKQIVSMPKDCVIRIDQKIARRGSLKYVPIEYPRKAVGYTAIPETAPTYIPRIPTVLPCVICRQMPLFVTGVDGDAYYCQCRNYTPPTTTSGSARLLETMGLPVATAETHPEPELQNFLNVMGWTYDPD